MPVFTLSSLRTKALSRLDSNTSLYTNTEIDFVINEAIRVTALFTGFYGVTATVAAGSVANKLVYGTPSSVFCPISVAFAGRPLQKVTLCRLAHLRRDWATDTVNARGPVDYWAPVGNARFVINPMDSTGGLEIAVTGLGTPPKLTGDSDVMVLENEYVELITEYCGHRLPLKEGGKTFADGSLALNTFYAKLKARKKYESMQEPRYWKLE